MKEIYEKLKKSKAFYDIAVYDVLESTNTTLKEMARNNEKEGKVIIAKEQTGGRGKMNRSFFSPKGSGIYMSILLKPDLRPEEAVFITAVAAVATAEAIEAVSGQETKVKWVNDIYCKGKKVCGILTESGFGLYSNKIGYGVVGIGINLKEAETGFPGDITHIAGAVFESENYSEEKKYKIIAEILERFYNYYLEMSMKTFLEGYRNRSNVIGRKILINRGDESKMAVALDIDNDCRLAVKYDDGSCEALISGDVSIKL